ncbi:hypothetical protein A0H76_952 [Hepatospora eriocheir]|uniref:Uncharacterized protein n=1 Tax=Hepatospora eriocheir TaxID=1081669 RepID=A0A1X0Q6D0_9MICR|nr:hypothetical protein A0H76_952 [Hepatospora eriocheir]
MVYGSISYQGVGRLVFIKNTMIGAVYKQILAKNLRQSANEMGIDLFIFIHNNDPKYTSSLLKTGLM